MFLGSSLISWHSKRQDVMSRSSTEAEYHAMADTTVELWWLRDLLCDMGVSVVDHVKCIMTIRVPMLLPPNLSFIITQNILRSTVILLVRNLKKGRITLSYIPCKS